jgi:hypothetical protein
MPSEPPVSQIRLRSELDDELRGHRRDRQVEARAAARDSEQPTGGDGPRRQRD